MELTVLEATGVPHGGILSIRAGTTRRQAPIPIQNSLRFPTLPLNASPLKIDVLSPVGGCRVHVGPEDDEYNVSIETADGKGRIGLRLGIREAPQHCGKPSSELRMSEDTMKEDQATSPKGRLNAALEAREYLDMHNLFNYVQEMLKYVISQRPEDPYEFMVGYLSRQRKAAAIPRAESAPPLASLVPLPPQAPPATGSPGGRPDSAYRRKFMQAELGSTAATAATLSAESPEPVRSCSAPPGVALEALQAPQPNAVESVDQSDQAATDSTPQEEPSNGLCSTAPAMAEAAPESQPPKPSPAATESALGEVSEAAPVVESSSQVIERELEGSHAPVRRDAECGSRCCPAGLDCPVERLKAKARETLTEADITGLFQKVLRTSQAESPSSRSNKLEDLKERAIRDLEQIVDNGKLTEIVATNSRTTSPVALKAEVDHEFTKRENDKLRAEKDDLLRQMSELRSAIGSRAISSADDVAQAPADPVADSIPGEDAKAAAEAELRECASCAVGVLKQGLQNGKLEEVMAICRAPSSPCTGPVTESQEDANVHVKVVEELRLKANQSLVMGIRNGKLDEVIGRCMAATPPTETAPISSAEPLATSIEGGPAATKSTPSSGSKSATDIVRQTPTEELSELISNTKCALINGYDDGTLGTAVGRELGQTATGLSSASTSAPTETTLAHEPSGTEADVKEAKEEGQTRFTAASEEELLKEQVALRSESSRLRGVHGTLSAENLKLKAELERLLLEFPPEPGTA